MKIRFRHGPRLYPDHRPRTRGECFTFPRPCPFVSCRYHLAIDAHRTIAGAKRLRVLNDDPTAMDNTCALDVADGRYVDSERALAQQHDVDHEDESVQLDLQEIGDLVGIERERVRQHILRAQERLRAGMAQSLEDYSIEPPEDGSRPLVPAYVKVRGIILGEIGDGQRTPQEVRAAVVDRGHSEGEAISSIEALKRTSMIESVALPNATDAAVAKLADALTSEPRLASEVMAQVMDDVGCTERTVRKAAKHLGVQRIVSGDRGKRESWTFSGAVPTAPATKRHTMVMLRRVGGGQAHLRDPGHPGKARGSD